MKKKKNQKGKRYPSNIYQYGGNDPRAVNSLSPNPTEPVDINYGNQDIVQGVEYENPANSRNWASNNMGTIGAIAGGAGNIVNMATSGQPTEVEDYVDVVQDTVASVIPVAGIFHTAAGIGENIAASTAGGDAYDNQRAADIAERIWQPHTWLTKGLPGKRKDSNIPGAYIQGTQIDDPYESQANNIAAFAKYGGNIYQNSSADGMPVESIHYRDRIYDLGPALGKQHYSKLKPALQRRLDYLFGESGMRDADTGEIIYTTNTPTLTKGNRTNLFNPIEAEKAGGDMKYSTIKNPFYGLTIGDREIPHGESWRVPSKYLGKDYPTALVNTKNYGGNIYQHSPAPLKTTTGGNKAIIPSTDYIAAYEKLGLGPMPPNAVITAADLEHFENTGFARGYELPTDITETVETIDPKTVVKNNMKIPYPKVSYPYRKGEHYIDAHGRKLPIASRSNNYQYGGQPGSVPTTEFNAGGSHDENPLGGIPQGMHPNGKPNLVEEGELKITDPRNDEFFVISPKVKLDKATAEEFDLPKRYIGKDMVKIFNSVLRKESKRDGDTIEEHSKELEIAPYIDAHKKLSAEKNAEEEAKEQAAFAEDMGEMVEKYPEYMQALMSQGQQGPSPEEQQMMEQQMMAQQQGGMPQGQPSPEQMAMMQQQGAPQQGMAPQGPPMMEHGSYMQYLNGGNIHQLGQAGGLTREEQMKANPNLSFHTNVLKNDPNSLSSLGKTAAGFGAADMSSAKNNLESAQFYNNLNAEMAGYANNKQLGGGMPQQQMQPQQQRQGQEIVQQVAQALQQGANPKEIMAQLVQSGMPEEQAGQLLQQIMQQLQGGGQGQQMANGGNIYQSGGGLTEAQKEFFRLEKLHEEAREAIGKNDIKTLEAIGLDHRFNVNDLSGLWAELQDARKKANFSGPTSLYLDARNTFPHIGQQIKSVFTQGFGIDGSDYDTSGGILKGATNSGALTKKGNKNQNGGNIYQNSMPNYMINAARQGNVNPWLSENSAYQNLKLAAGENSETDLWNNYVTDYSLYNPNSKSYEDPTKVVDVDTNLDEGQTYEYQKPLAGALEAVPVLSNMAMALFNKEKKVDSSRYLKPISAKEFDITEAKRSMNRQLAGIRKKLGATGYQNNLLAAQLSGQEAIAKLEELKQNKDAQNQLLVDRYNSDANFRANVTADQINQAIDQRNRAYWDTAATQFGQIGARANVSELQKLFTKMYAPNIEVTEKGMFEDMFGKKDKKDKK